MEPGIFKRARWQVVSVSHPCSGKQCPPGKNQHGSDFFLAGHSRCDELAVCQRVYSTDVVPNFGKMSAEQRAEIRKVLRRVGK